MNRALLIPVLSLLAAGSALAAAAQPATLDLRADKQPLFALVERIARQCDAGLIVHHELQARMQAPVTIIAKDAKWNDAIALLASEYHIALKLAGDRLEVTDADGEFRKRLVMVTYDLRHLTAVLDSFPGPDLDIPEPGGAGSRLLPPIEPETKPEINEFIEIVQKQVAPESWTREGVAIEDYNGAMVVTQVPEIQAQVAALIAQFERTTARQVVCRCYRLAQAPGEGAPVLDAKAWQAAAQGLAPPVATFVTLDEQGNHHFSGVQRAYIADADVNQETFDPIVSILSSGLGVDVEPRVTISGVLATVRLDATIAQRFTVAQVNDGRGQKLLPLEMPDASSDTSRDTRLVPPGGAALYRFGERTYALTFEVLDYAKAAPAAKP
jgi:hypothetical protein